MPEQKARKLSDVIPQYAPEGSNDARWFLLEHQLYEARFALSHVRSICEAVGDLPENEEERELARSVLEIISGTYVRLLGDYAAVHALLSGSDVAERMGGKENG
jgi:hypothetical protein